ncbi:hypothetical protein ACFX11_043243 [Malus domestica]
MGSLKAYSRPHKGTYLDSSYFSSEYIEYRRSSNGKPQGLFKAHKGTYLNSFYSLGSALPDKSCPIKPCPTSPPVKQELDRKHQPEANLSGSGVLVGQEASPTEIPATNTITISNSFRVNSKLISLLHFL